MKRYQDCNRLIKIWRNRHYIPVPFKWVWHNYITPFNFINEHEGKEALMGRELWGVLLGVAQCKMEYIYTMEEVNKMFADKYGWSEDDD